MSRWVAAELLGPNGTRSHLLDTRRRARLIRPYRASSSRSAQGGLGPRRHAGAPNSRPPSPGWLYLRPSRYCPSDHLVGFAVAEFGTESPSEHG